MKNVLFLAVLSLFFSLSCDDKETKNNQTTALNQKKFFQIFPPSSLLKLDKSDLNKKLIEVNKNTGGSTLSFEVILEDQSKFIFKPEQEKARLVPPRYELAAYLISQELSLNMVPTVMAKSFNFKHFINLAKKKANLKTLLEKREKELDVRDGKLNGIIMEFVPDLRQILIDNKYGLDSKKGIARWLHYLQASTTIPEDQKNLVMQISDTLVFDFIIGNQDRWSGMNILATVKEKKKNLVLIDNAMAFGKSGEGAGISNSIRACFASGGVPSPNYNNIDFVTIATTGDATDFGDTLTSFGYRGGASDSHGGLTE